MKPAYVIGALSLLGIGGFLWFRSKNGASPFSQPSSNYNLNGPSQPAQLYPVQPVVSPRVDNANQPWYQNTPIQQNPSLAAIAKVDTNFMNNVSYIQGAASIVKDVSSIWSDLGVSSWFSDAPVDAATSTADFTPLKLSGGVNQGYAI